jgi:hypothetical protein
MYMLDSALEGYGNMFPRTGFFELSSDMIAVTKQGRVKVWFNKNFAKNFPEFNKLDHNKTESDFIVSLVNVVEECTDYGKETEKFSDFLKKMNQTIGFASTKTALKHYHSAYKLLPQRTIKSIVVWLQSQSIQKPSSIKS